MTPVSSFEEAFWRFLPPVLTAFTYASILISVVCLTLCWRESRRRGFLLLAVAVGLPLVFSAVAAVSKRSVQKFDRSGLPVIETTVRIDVPIISMITCCGAILLYRDERKPA